MACNSCSSSPCQCEALQIQRGPRGFTGQTGPAPVITAEVETLAAGSDATVNFTGGAGVYNMLLGIPVGATGPQGPAGANGTNGIAFTTLTAAFTQPALGNLETITVGSTAFMQLDQPIYIAQGGTYIAASNALSATQIIVRNPGALDGYPLGVVGQTAPGATVPVSGSLSQVTVGGRPGRDGTNGTPGPQGVPGPASIVTLTTTIPTLPPAPGGELVAYTDSLVTPTIFQFYFYSGGSWRAGPNIMGTPGTLTVSTGGNPNTTLPTGPIGTFAYRTDVPSLWLKTGAVTWVLLFTFTPTFAQVAAVTSGLIDSATVYTNRIVGYTPLVDTHTSPGVYILDLAYQGIEISADKDLELNWDDTNYSDYGQWTVTIENVDASPINLTYTAARWFKKTGLTLPATLAAGATQHYNIIKTSSGMMITETSVVLAV